MRSLLSGILILISVIAIIAASTFCSTIKNNMTDAVVGSCTGDIQIHNSHIGNVDIYSSPAADTPLMTHSDSVCNLLKSVSGVKYITQRLRLQGLLMTSDQSTTTVLTGIQPAVEQKISNKLKIIEGSYLTRKNGVIIGKNLRDDMGIKPGQTIKYYISGADGKATEIKLIVDGVFDSDGLGMYMDTYMYANLNYLRDNLKYNNGEASDIAVALNGAYSRNTVINNLKQKISSNSLNLKVDKWETVANTYASVISASALVPTALLFLVFFIVLIGLINVVVMNMISRIRETKVLIALGTNNIQTSIMFSLEYLILGLIFSLIAVAICVPVILTIGYMGIPATSETVKYVFGGSYLHIQLNLAVLLETTLAFTLFPALIAFIVCFKKIRNLSLVNIN